MSKMKPEIRFEEYKNGWQKVKLGDVVEQGKSYPLTRSVQTNDDTGFRYVHYGDIHIKNSSIFLADSDLPSITPDSYYTLKKGDMVIADASEDYEGIGKPSVINFDPKESIVAGLHTIVLKPKVESIYPLFLYYVLTTNSYKEFMKVKATGAKVLGISYTQLKEYEFCIPGLAEQKVISSFIFNYEGRIHDLTMNCEKLKQFKQAMLQKMFPKEGETVPEIRFDGFDEDWEQREFKDNIVSIQTGTNLLGSKMNTGIPLLKMGNIQRGYFSLNKLEYLDERQEVEQENIAQYGDFLFNTRNTLELVGKGATWMGESKKYAFNSNIARVTFDGIDTIFFNYLYNTEQMILQVQARAVGTTSVAAVYPKDLNSMKYYLPTFYEQKKIGEFFTSLDNLITLHQRELTKLKQLKQALLDKMFV